ncbi:Apolipoprotein L6 [Lemmus lemmus]
MHRHTSGGQLHQCCVWGPDNPWSRSGPCDSRSQSGTFSHRLGPWGSSGCDECFVEKASTASMEAEASQLLPGSNDTENDTKSSDTEKDIKKIVEKNTPRLFSVFMKTFRKLEGMKMNIDAIKLTKASPRLANSAKRLMTTGKVSARSTRQVKKAFGGTALAMTKGARITGAATAGLTLVLDVVSLMHDSKHLLEGAKAESAAKLRQHAQDLEQKLQELIWVHDSLTQ